MPSIPTILQLEAVSLGYDNVVVVRELSLTVGAGEIFGLLGPNGSGKSTTIAAIVGAHRLQTGTIRVQGRVEAEDPRGYRRLIGLVPQDLALYEELTARQNLHFFGRLYGLGGRDLQRRTEEVLDFVCLSDRADRPARTYSGGMQRRLNLACALLHRPVLLLLDEPTVGIDIQSRDAIFAALRNLAAEGTSLVYTTHHLEEAEQLCDRIGIMDQGRLLTVGSIHELCASSMPAGWRLDGPHTGGGLERLFLDLTGRSLREP